MLKQGVTDGPHLSRHLRGRHEEPRHRPPARGAGRGPALAGDARRRSPATADGGEPVEIEPDEDGPLVAYVFKTLADPYTGRVNLFRVYRGTLRSDSHAHQRHPRPEGADRPARPAAGQGAEAGARSSAPGDIGAVAKLKETQAGDVLCERQEEIAFAPLDLPAPVMAFAYEPRSKGDEEKAAAAVRRLTEEDPTLDVHRDPQTGEQIIAGLTQVHVEVIVERMKRRFGVEIELHPPRVPYQETIRSRASAHARYKKQSGGRGQFADCQIEIEPAEEGLGLEFVNQIKGAAIPGSFIPAVEKGIVEAMEHGTVAGYPVKDVRVRLVDGKHHDVDSSEMAFKIAGSMAFRQAMEEADPVLLEPIVTPHGQLPRGRRRRRHRRPQLAPRPSRWGWSRRARRPRSRPRCRWRRSSTTRPTCARSAAAGLTSRWSSSATRRCPATSLTGLLQHRGAGTEAERLGAPSPLLVWPCDPGRDLRRLPADDPGRRAHAHLPEPEAGPRSVCDLCRGRAAALGWAMTRRLLVPTSGAGHGSSCLDTPRARLLRAIERFNAERGGPDGRRPDAHARSALGLGRRRRRLGRRGADHRRLGALLVSVGRRPRRRARLRPRARPRQEIEQLDSSARQWNARAGEGGRCCSAQGARPPARWRPVG